MKYIRLLRADGVSSVGKYTGGGLVEHRIPFSVLNNAKFSTLWLGRSFRNSLIDWNERDIDCLFIERTRKWKIGIIEILARSSIYATLGWNCWLGIFNINFLPVSSICEQRQNWIFWAQSIEKKIIKKFLLPPWNYRQPFWTKMGYQIPLFFPHNFQNLPFS